MTTNFERKEVLSIMDKVKDTLKGLGEELNVSFDFNGGRIEGSKAILKLTVVKLSESGGITSDRRTDDGARWEFARAGITVSGPVIGSIWKEDDGSLLQIVGYQHTRRKYPIEIHRLGEDKNKVTSAKWFAGNKQILSPSSDEFYFWCKVDPDLLSDKDRKCFDFVNDWLTLYVPEKQQDNFFNAVNAILDCGVMTRHSSDKILSIITQENTEWDLIIHQLIEFYK